MRKIFLQIFFLIVIISLYTNVQAEQPIVSHDMELNFNLDEHILTVVDNFVITHDGSDRINFLINKDFTVKKVYVEKKKAKKKVFDTFDYSLFGAGFDDSDSSYFSRAQMVNVKLKKKFIGLETLHVKAIYSGVVYDTVSTASFSRVNIADQTTGLIGTEGIYLSPETMYYPVTGEGMSVFSVTTNTPADYLTVTDGRLDNNSVKKSKKGDRRMMRWTGTYPADGLYLSGAVWELREDEHNGTKVYGFFFAEDSALSVQYVDASKSYLQMYEELLGKYPYAKFAAVENFFPTGYGMPSWTLLGQAVVRLPWIVDISLGHEVAHNWWGNGVFVDYKSGNWCEGLTTYCADYLYKERKPPYSAKGYRMTVNQDFTAYVTEANDFPLTQFRSREETYTRAIGYGKTMMVYHMLRKYLGEDAFWAGLKKFYNDNLFKFASWADIQSSFESVSGKDLDWYFQQWVEKPGAPELVVSNVSLNEDTSGYAIKFDLDIKGSFKLNVPVVVSYPNKEETHWNLLSEGTHTIELNAIEKPSGIAVDPEFDVFRILSRDEYPASLAEVFGAEKQIIILPTNTDSAMIAAYTTAASSINRNKKAKVMNDIEVTPEILKDASCFIFGTPGENFVYRIMKDAGIQKDKWVSFNESNKSLTLQGNTLQGDNISCMVTLRNPLNKEQSIAVFAAYSAEEITRTAVKLVHYGKYSYLTFDGGKNKQKGSWDIISSPLMHKFKNDPEMN